MSMQHVETIIVGGGPAGSSCARELLKHNHEVLILDRQKFPRVKLCAGWITGQVMRDLEFTPADYPGSIMELKVRSHIPFLPVRLPGLPTGDANYSIRRVEFDAWLLKRSGAPVQQHAVQTIRQENEHYVIDEKFRCRNLVGAGGTMCPVRRSFFPANRNKAPQIATLEQEFVYSDREETCHLYFGYHGLKGYAWYVPKADGAVNIGIGAKSKSLKKSGWTIHDHLRSFLARLVKQGRIDQETVAGLKFTGHPYFLASYRGEVQTDRCYLIGDSAGLATLDLGEGIGPAVESGQLAARSILGQIPYSREQFTQYSLGGLSRRIAQRLFPIRGEAPATKTKPRAA